jgi:hypothetical protein
MDKSATAHNPYPLADMFTNLGNQTQPDPIARAKQLLDKVEHKGKDEHQKKAEEICDTKDPDHRRLCDYVDRTFASSVGMLDQLLPQAAAARSAQVDKIKGQLPSSRVVTRDITLGAQLRSKMG